MGLESAHSRAGVAVGHGALFAVGDSVPRPRCSRTRFRSRCRTADLGSAAQRRLDGRADSELVQDIGLDWPSLGRPGGAACSTAQQPVDQPRDVSPGRREVAAQILRDLVVGLTGKNLVEQVCLFFAQRRFQLICAPLHDG